MLVLYASGRTTGLVLHLGHKYLTTLGLYEGYLSSVFIDAKNNHDEKNI